MLIIAFTAVARWRRPILLAGLALAVVLGVLDELGERGGRFPLFTVWAGLSMVLLVLFVVAAYQYHPATLVARPQEPAFTTRANPARVFAALLFTLQGGLLVADNIHDIVDGDELWGFSAALIGLWALVLGLHWRLTWGWFGIQLRPDGLYDQQPLGSWFVPWDAFVRAYPAVPDGSQRVALYLERPELVRRRGLRIGGSKVQAAGIDAAFLAWTINVYVTDSGHRSAIGTEAELQRLTAPAAR